MGRPLILNKIEYQICYFQYHLEIIKFNLISTRSFFSNIYFNKTFKIRGFLKNIVVLAQEEGFWSNMVRYARYFVTVMIGTVFIAFRPAKNFSKEPKSFFLVIIGFSVAI